MADKNLAYYMNLPYTAIVREMNDESGHYFHGIYLELDGCQSDGKTVEELFSSLEEAREGWLSVKLEHGDPIPEPQGEYSGRVVVRMPKTLHRNLAAAADLEGISLNQYMLYKLSK